MLLHPFFPSCSLSLVFPHSFWWLKMVARLCLCVCALACAPALTYTNAAGSAFFNLFQPQPTNQVRINESLYIINKCIVAVPSTTSYILRCVGFSSPGAQMKCWQKTIWSLWISSMANHTRSHRLILEHQLRTAKSCQQTWKEYNKPTLNLMLQSNYFYTYISCMNILIHIKSSSRRLLRN